MKNIKNVIILVLLCCFLFSSCKGKDKEKATQSDVVSTQTPVVSEADDSVDPENTENFSENGTKVSVKEVEKKTGKLNGIDVSYWQGKIDWSKVKADGIDFAIVRIGYRAENGKLYRDNNADYNIQQAQKNGILVGVYFFSTAISTSEAEEEASFVIDAVKGYKISCPVIYDCEGYLKNDSRMYNLTKEERTNNADAFLKKVKNSGYDVMFYGAKNEIENSLYWDTNYLENKYKIWVAYYSTPTYPQIESPNYLGKYDMWQYTNRGSVNGINGNCDLIVSYIDFKEAKPKDSNAEIKTATAPKTEEEKLYTDVSDSVTAKEIVNLRSGAGMNFEVVATLKSGDFLNRIGIGKNGWSKLIYNGKTVYAITSYLTDKVVEVPKKDIVNGMEFIPHNDSVTAKIEVNLRGLPTTDSESVGKLVGGTFLNRTAISNNGWSRLEYNGQVVYAVSSYLTTEAPVISSKPVETDTVTEHGMIFKTITPVNVTAKDETNLREKPTTDSNIVYTLKNGEYITKNAVSDSGWARLEYNGQTVYAVNSFLF